MLAVVLEDGAQPVSASAMVVRKLGEKSWKNLADGTNTRGLESACLGCVALKAENDDRREARRRTA